MQYIALTEQLLLLALLVLVQQVLQRGVSADDEVLDDALLVLVDEARLLEV
jgi:hypothetical protein